MRDVPRTRNQHSQRHPCNFVRVEKAGAVQTAGHAVRIANRFDFVHVKVAAELVKVLVELLEHADDHERRRPRADAREADDVAEQHRHVVVGHGLDGLAEPEALGDVGGEDQVEQADVLLPLLGDGRVSLLDRGPQLVHAAPHAVLRLRLLAHQDHLARRVVQRDVGDEEAVPRQPVQPVEERRAHEQQRVRLGAQHHPALDVEPLARVRLARDRLRRQQERRVRAARELAEADAEPGRPLELKVSRDMSAVRLERVAEQLAEPGAELDDVEALVHDEVPRKGFAERRRAHPQVGREGGRLERRQRLLLLLDGVVRQLEHVAIALGITLEGFDDDARVHIVEDARQRLQRAEHKPRDYRTLSRKNQFTVVGTNKVGFGFAIVL